MYIYIYQTMSSHRSFTDGIKPWQYGFVKIEYIHPQKHE